MTRLVVCVNAANATTLHSINMHTNRCISQPLIKISNSGPQPTNCYAIIGSVPAGHPLILDEVMSEMWWGGSDKLELRIISWPDCSLRARSNQAFGGWYVYMYACMGCDIWIFEFINGYISWFNLLRDQRARVIVSVVCQSSKASQASQSR